MPTNAILQQLMDVRSVFDRVATVLGANPDCANAIGGAAAITAISDLLGQDRIGVGVVEVISPSLTGDLRSVGAVTSFPSAIDALLGDTSMITINQGGNWFSASGYTTRGGVFLSQGQTQALMALHEIGHLTGRLQVDDTPLGQTLNENWLMH